MQFLRIKGSGDILAGWFWPWIPCEGTVKLLAGPTVSKDLTGARESIPKSFIWVLPKGFKSLRCGPFHETVYNMASPRVMRQRERENESMMEAVVSFMEVTYHLFCHILLVTQTTAVECRKGTMHKYEYQKEKIIGPSQRLITTLKCL